MGCCPPNIPDFRRHVNSRSRCNTATVAFQRLHQRRHFDIVLWQPFADPRGRAEYAL